MLFVMHPTGTTLQRLERYYDSAPRYRSRVEEIGSFTLFMAESGWPYYARPRLGETATATVDDVREVLSRQRELGVPQAIEWVDETTPGLVEVVRSAGASVGRCPLLMLAGEPVGAAGTARLLDADDQADLAAAHAAIGVSFQHGGTSSGSAGLEARDQELRSGAAGDTQPLRDLLAEGRVRIAAVYSPDAPNAGPVGGGSSIPVHRVAEIVGVGVLPAFRRRGLAGHLTYVLAQDALELGVTNRILLSPVRRRSPCV